MDQARLNELKKLCDEATAHNIITTYAGMRTALPELITAFEGLGKDYEKLYEEHTNLINSANVKAIDKLKAEVERLKAELEFANDVVKEREFWASMRLKTCKKLEDENASLTEKLAVAVAALEGLQKYVAYNGDDWVRLEASEALASIRGNNG